MPRRDQTLADYAAVALAPILIFIMLVSLGGFQMLLLYNGQYPVRVMWIVMCYTMGVTALARISIEQSRSYSFGYAIGLGAAYFIVTVRFFGNPIFAAVSLFVVGYLADRIVHDCTIVDDEVDSSGQGLVDSGQNFLAKFLTRDKRPTNADLDGGSVEPALKGKRGHQPGRTVLYLAIGALPLFGIGQFFLSNRPGAWEQARWFLTIYLFSSLSLLVVTAFLNLRRYLRQRDTEMPWEVTASWLMGGIAMIVAILLMAFLAPLPGRTLASWKMPEFFENAEPMESSEYGWGDEAVGDNKEGSARSESDQQGLETSKDAKGASSSTQKGAPPGGKKGDRQDGPTGQTPGGKKKGAGEGESKDKSQQQNTEDKSGSSAKSDEPTNDSPSKQKSENQPSDKQDAAKQQQSNAEPAPKSESKQSESKQEGQPEPSQQPDSSSDSKESSETPNDQNAPDRNTPDKETSDQNTPDPKSDDSSSDEPPNDDSKTNDEPPNPDDSDPSNDQEPSEDKPSEDKPSEDKPSEDKPSDAEDEPDQEESQSEGESAPPDPPSPESSSNPLAGLLNGLGNLLKFIIFAGLVAVVAAYLYLQREAIAQWWRSLFGVGDEGGGPDGDETSDQDSAPVIPRSFASFQNPVGNADSKTVVVVTFQALEAWGYEQGFSRGADETPSEFARRLVTQFPKLGKSALRVVDAYNRVVYGRTDANDDDVRAASSVWGRMRPAK